MGVVAILAVLILSISLALTGAAGVLGLVFYLIARPGSTVRTAKPTFARSDAMSDYGAHLA
jgi:hypothetical protein